MCGSIVQQEISSRKLQTTFYTIIHNIIIMGGGMCCIFRTRHQSTKTPKHICHLEWLGGHIRKNTSKLNFYKSNTLEMFLK